VRAFGVTWRTIVSLYNELFLLVGMSCLWWVTGGLFVGLAVYLGLFVLPILNGPEWWLIFLVPLAAIPAGPATAALANVTSRAARELHVDGSYYWEGWRACWRKALTLNAINMGILAILLFNLFFYASRPGFVQIIAFLWLYLILFWLGMQIYLFPILARLENPSIFSALRNAAILTFANPLFSIALVLLAATLTGVSIGIAILLLLAWPALMSLLGHQALSLFIERAGGVKKEEGS
jgi:uncharacterized membrane protein YesL